MDSRLSAFLERADAVLARLEPLLPAPRQTIDWNQCLAARWQREGRNGFLLPLDVSLDMRLSDLIGVDKQRETLARNTQQFIDGLPANHALLWGSRGTGKSSMVRALLAQHAKAGLRLIEIERDHLADLPRVVEQLLKLPQRFILFCDDLSFEAGEGDYRVLKSVLDGSLEQAPENVLLYATSNRRHLVPENQSDNDNWKRVDGELHPSEAVEDKIALSDRFGLWLSFYPFTQEHFLDVVEQVASQVFVPLCVGGGLSHIDDMDAVLQAGAEKVSLNTAAVKNPGLISEGAARYGSQAIVVGMDVLKVPVSATFPSGYQIYINGGRTPVELDAIAWAKKCQELGAGELCINSIDADGTLDGYEISLNSTVAGEVRIPIIASGGAGNPGHIHEVLTKGKASAALLASIVHYGSYSIKELKEYASERGVPMRLTW